MPRLSIGLAKPKTETRELSGKAKLDDVTRLMKILETDLEKKNLLASMRDATLEQLRVHGRRRENADPIFTKEGIATLSKHAFETNSLSTSREALRCLANALLLDASLRQAFVNVGYCGQAAERLKSLDSDDEFLISRILFLTTYDSDLNFDDLFDNHGLGDSINANIARHSKQFSKGGKKFELPAIDSAALAESLKLLFNISNFYPHRAVDFSPSITNILKILNRIKIPHPPLQSPINYLINALVNLDLDDRKAKRFDVNPLFPKFNQNTNVDKFINILDQAVAAYKPAQLEALIVPLLTVLRKIHEFAPDGARKYMQWLLLPEDDERDMPIGQSDTLSSRLLRLSTSSTSPSLREAISSLMFELSGKDAKDFVHNVGYGFAAGFLMSHDMPVPDNANEAFSSQKSPGGSSSKEGMVNPITGQRFDAEPKDTGPPMTQAEKEREAEKLFVLFERLKATGVVDVKNPVQEAVDSGRFEEVEDPD